MLVARSVYYYVYLAGMDYMELDAGLLRWADFVTVVTNHSVYI